VLICLKASLWRDCAVSPRCTTVHYLEAISPARFKEAFLTTVIKKAGLDATDVSSYRPISKLSVLLKLLERLVVQQLKSSNLLPQLQSGFRSGHSTETSVLRLLSDILQAVDQGDVVALVILDLVSCV